MDLSSFCIWQINISAWITYMNPGSVWPSKSCQSGSIKTKQYLLTEQLATQRISSWIRKQDNNPYSLGINSSGTKMNRERGSYICCGYAIVVLPQFLTLPGGLLSSRRSWPKEPQKPAQTSFYRETHFTL